YTIETNAVDVATNEEGYGLKSTFVYDITPPTAAISYPYDGAYISQTGKIYGGSYDQPNGIVEKVFVRIEQLSGPHIGEFWSVGDTQWTSVGAPEVWNEVPLYGTLSPSATWWQLNAAPWQSGETYEMNIKVVDRALNYQNVYSTVTGISADFTAPTSTVTYPAYDSTINTELTIISGSASDMAPGQLDEVKLSYFKCDGALCSTGKYWNIGAGLWNLDTEEFYAADITGNTWEATGASTPTWVTTKDGIYYRIFAKAIDKAQNEISKTGPAIGPWIQFKLKTPAPDTSINVPIAGQPYSKPADLTTVSGDVIYATTVQVRIINTTPNPDMVWLGNGNVWESTVTYLAGCTEDTYVIGQSTCGFFGTDNLLWSKDVNGIWPAGTNKFKLAVRGYNDDEIISELSPFDERFFHIDGDLPDSTLIKPVALYENPFSKIEGTATDTGLGYITSVEITISTDNLNSFWDGSFWVAGSSWLIVNAGDGVFNENNEYWYLDTQLPSWETDKKYELQVKITDKAGNIRTAPSDFTIDVSSPTAGVVEPSTGSIRFISQISGTALDNWENNDVEIAIRQLGSTPLWFDDDELSFELIQSATHWISMSSKGDLSPDAKSWTYAPAGLDSKFTPGSSGLQYQVLSRAIDTAGNVQEILGIDISSVVINIDRKAPVSSIILPLDNSDGISGRYLSANIGKSGTNSRLNGSISDSFYNTNNAGVEETEIRLAYLLANDTYYWNGSLFTNAVSSDNAWLPVSESENPPNWDWVYLPDVTWDGNRDYTLEVRSMDKSRPADDPMGEGNWEMYPYVSHTFTVNDAAPLVEITTPTALAVKSISQIDGTADAGSVGFYKSWIRISTGTALKKYWKDDGNEWVADAETW
ncbi:MAG: Ig-like domain repeat protein, partial [Elusimicrobiales bacterium]|nr:Ig-like domain repeat protein [Elusimicrobiales bacterium]